METLACSLVSDKPPLYRQLNGGSVARKKQQSNCSCFEVDGLNVSAGKHFLWLQASSFICSNHCMLGSSTYDSCVIVFNHADKILGVQGKAWQCLIVIDGKLWDTSEAEALDSVKLVNPHDHSTGNVSIHRNLSKENKTYTKWPFVISNTWFNVLPVTLLQIYWNWHEKQIIEQL